MKKTENTPSTSLTALPVPLTRHTNTPGWQPSSDTPSQSGNNNQHLWHLLFPWRKKQRSLRQL